MALLVRSDGSAIPSVSIRACCNRCVAVVQEVLSAPSDMHGRWFSRLVNNSLVLVLFRSLWDGLHPIQINTARPSVRA